MNDKKIQSLLALAQLDAAQNQPDPREAMASQMLMQLLGMNQQQETQAGQMDLDRERMAQAMEQFRVGQENNMALSREELDVKRAQQEALLGQAERQHGMEMLKVMSENQRAADEANQKQVFQEENRKLALKQLLAGIIQSGFDPEARQRAMQEYGWTSGTTPGSAPAAGAVDMETILRQKKAQSGNVNTLLGLPENYKSPLHSLFH